MVKVFFVDGSWLALYFIVSGEMQDHRSAADRYQLS
jgi:hypothetical protein